MYIFYDGIMVINNHTISVYGGPGIPVSSTVNPATAGGQRAGEAGQHYLSPHGHFPPHTHGKFSPNTNRKGRGSICPTDFFIGLIFKLFVEIS